MSDAEKLAEEIIQAIAKDLHNLANDDFALGLFEPGLGRALRLARKVVAKWKEKHGDE